MEKRSLPILFGVGLGLGLATCSCWLSRLIKERKQSRDYFIYPKCSQEKDDIHRVVVTGGAGFIGSHTCLLLLQAGWEVYVLDNLVNSCQESLKRVGELSEGLEKKLHFIKVDLCDFNAVENIFLSIPVIEAVIHFAGLKAVGESVQEPLLYYENNLLSTINLLKAMDTVGCNTIIFSSSATVYGNAPIPLTEQSNVGTGITNPYGQTKYMIEIFLRDLYESSIYKMKNKTQASAGKGKNIGWNIVVLRYFNPIGAHPSGRIGEDPNGPPNNLMPYVSQVAVGKRELLTVYGNDYKTKDGTGVRDYIHVMDLARGHISALDYTKGKRLQEKKQRKDGVAGQGSYDIFNLGTGKGYSVLEMVKAMERGSGKEIKYKIGARREGDLDEVYSDPTLAKEILGWEATKGLEEMCEDLWRWQSQNPNGFK